MPTTLQSDNTILYDYAIALGFGAPQPSSDTITYTATNSSGYESEIATIYITITPPNFNTLAYAPDFTVKASSTIITKIILKAYDSDPNSNLTYRTVSRLPAIGQPNSSNQALPIVIAIDSRTSYIDYNSAGFIGTETIEYDVSNDGGSTYSNIGTITINVTAPATSTFHCVQNVTTNLPDYNQPYNQTNGPTRSNTGRLFEDFDAWCAPTCGSQLLSYWYLEHNKLFTTQASTVYGDPDWNYYQLDSNRKQPYIINKLEIADIGWHMNTNNLGNQGMSSNSAHIGTFVSDIHKGLWNTVKAKNSLSIQQVVIGGTYITITLFEPHSYQVNDKVVIEGYNYQDLNNEWTIVSIPDAPTNLKFKIDPSNISNFYIQGTNNGGGANALVRNIEIGISTVSNSFAYGYDTDNTTQQIKPAMNYALTNTNMFDDIKNEINNNRPVIINFISYHLLDLNKKSTIQHNSETLTDVSYYKIQPQGPINVENEIREQYNYGEDGFNIGHSCIAVALIPKGSTYDISMGNNSWLIVKDNDPTTSEYVAIEFDIGVINSISKMHLKNL